MVPDLMTNCRHLILFLVVPKILASLKLTTVFTVTTECISQNSSEKKVPTTIRHYCSFTKTRPVFFFRRNWDSFFSFDMATPQRKNFSKLTRRNADGQNVHHQRVTQTVQAVHPCERCRGRLRCLVVCL